ncbi:MAG: hypothetical protein QM696_08995 [Steroidobacteraceae bacterium]
MNVEVDGNVRAHTAAVDCRPRDMRKAVMLVYGMDADTAQDHVPGADLSVTLEPLQHDLPELCIVLTSDDTRRRGRHEGRRIGRCDLRHVRFALQSLAEEVLVSLKELMDTFFHHSSTRESAPMIHHSLALWEDKAAPR